MLSLDPIRESLQIIGQRPEDVLGPDMAHIVAYGHQVVSEQ
jgi:hypothetical protein